MCPISASVATKGVLTGDVAAFRDEPHERDAVVTATSAPRLASGRAGPAHCLSPAVVSRVALANAVANGAIVVTGGAVRLTGSGLGCPTWPRCTDESFVTTPELAGHGVIEFGNRLLTFVLTAVAIATVVVVFRSVRRDLRPLAVARLPRASRRRRCSAASPC